MSTEDDGVDRYGTDDVPADEAFCETIKDEVWTNPVKYYRAFEAERELEEEQDQEGGEEPI